MAKSKEIFNDLNLMLRLNQHIEELTSDDTALLTKETSFKVLAELSALTNSDPREDAQFDHQRTEFRADDGSNLPFHLQGDQTFNEASALARRRQLRHSDAIKEKIHFLWHVARGTRSEISGTAKLGTAPPPIFLTPPTANAVTSNMKTVNEREYSDMMVLIFKVLRDDFVLETAQRQIQCDWEVDSHHGVALSYEQFFPAMFELVDVWTCDILENTYVRFLELLTRRITVRVVVFLDDMKLKLALSDNFDEAVVVKAIPLSTIKKFASVAKVMEGTGVRTVGELAQSDPHTVERQRVGYLERNTFSPVKIGDELQNLLNMFREISQQFQYANYSLHNMVLQKMQPSGANAGIPTSEAGGNQGETIAPLDMANPHGAGGSRTTDPVHGSGSGGGGSSSGVDRATNNGTMSTAASRADGSAAGWTVSMPSQEAPPGQLYDPTHSDGRKRPNGSTGLSGEWTGSQQVATFSGVGSGGLPTSSIANQGPHHRGIKRINTFHDLTTTETGVIDALKASFLIEKGISIQRKTNLDDMRTELTKFGVNSTGMDDAALADKYGSLYEMFVLRDGDNIKSLAQSILARIKMELAIHGIFVNEDEMEAMYDGFYGSVVAGSGDMIVADAKSWVDATVDNHSYGAYIKQEYHELKSIDEVKLLGTDADDAEFVSLLSTDLSDDEQGDDDQVERALESPKAVATLSRRPSLYRSTPDSPKKDADQSEYGMAIVNAMPSLSSLISQDDEDECDRDASFHGQPLASGGRQSGDLRHGASDADSAGVDPETNPSSWSGQQGDTMANNSGSGDNEAALLSLASPSTDADEQLTDDGATANQFDPSDDELHTLRSDKTNDTDANAFSTDLFVSGDDDDDLNSRKSSTITKASLFKASPAEDPCVALLSGLHSLQNESDREPQGVGFGYDEKPQQLTIEPSGPVQERPTVREPKIPDIVVGGVDTGRHIAVAARYIQLLGIGNVATVQPEANLMALLTSPARASVDLVCFDVGNRLDDALAKTKELVGLVGRRVILFGGDETQPQKTAVVARLCVEDGGALFFASVPMNFPALRGEILSFVEASPEAFIVRQRRATAVFGSIAATTTKLVTSSMRANNMFSIEDDHPRSVLTPPLSADNSGAKRKATTISAATPATAPMLSTMSSSPLQLPPVIVGAPPKRDESFSFRFRGLRAIDEMPGAESIRMSPSRFTPVVPSASQPSKANRKSPRISAALKRIMR